MSFSRSNTLFPTTNKQMTLPVSFLLMYICGSLVKKITPNINGGNAKSKLETDVTAPEKQGWGGGFKLIERSSLVVSGVPAEEISYSWITTSGLGSTSSYEWTGKRIYFDNRGELWQITMESTLDKTLQGNSDFDHFLQTFKILN